MNAPRDDPRGGDTPKCWTVLVAVGRWVYVPPQASSNEPREARVMGQSKVVVIFDHDDVQVQNHEHYTLIWWQPGAQPALIVAAWNTAMTWMHEQHVRIGAFEASAINDPDTGKQWVGVELAHYRELVGVNDDGSISTA